MRADTAAAPEDAPPVELALFPLQSVLFPGGLLGLKVFEARYLDLVSRCLRSGQGFGVVALRSGSEARRPGDTTTPSFETIGTVAEILEVDSPQSGILQLRCRGVQRFETRSVAQRPDGLWVAQVVYLPDDEAAAPGPMLASCARALQGAIETLKAQGAEPFLAPWQLQDASWVSNRWCEILPISQIAKQKLMALDDAQARLQLVADFLRTKGVVS
jgi:Lon protease-like protein